MIGHFPLMASCGWASSSASTWVLSSDAKSCRSTAPSACGHRAAKNAENTNAFGSTRDLRAEGVPFFVNAAFPALGDHHVEPKPLRIGPYAREPYDHAAFFNISAMSFGALSAPAVRALLVGVARAGIWMDTR